MGTSINQSSDRKSSNWKRVLVCYTQPRIPESRVINEIWRASENENIPISSQIKSEAIFSCYQAVKSSQNIQEALQKANQSIVNLKGNSIITEFAKRVIPSAFQSSNPQKEWTSFFFAEVTKYFISRDASGYVSKDNRNQSVKDLIDFKKNINNKVMDIVNSGAKEFKSKSEWDVFVDKSIQKLKTVQNDNKNKGR